MSKSFFEVFPTLKLNEDMKMLFTGVEVSKVATNSDRDYIHVHIFSRHLIQKHKVCEMEQMIKEQLFGTNRIQIAVIEEYELSRQYTPENLMREYFDSILFEVGQRSVVERNMLQTADWSFEEGNILCLKLMDTVVAKGRKDGLVELIRRIFEDRFHIPIEVRVLYKKIEDSKLKYNELRLQQEVEAIVEKNQAIRKERLQREEKQENNKEKAGKQTVDAGQKAEKAGAASA